MIKTIRKFLLKHDLLSYECCKYIKPTWNVITIDETEYLVTSKYSCYSIDWIFKDKIIEDNCLKINNELIIPMSQVKKIILHRCDEFIVHTYSWLNNRDLCWYNTLDELQEVDQNYQNKLQRYKSL